MKTLSIIRNNNIYLFFLLLLVILFIVPTHGDYTFGKQLSTQHSIYKLFYNKRSGLLRIKPGQLSTSFIEAKKRSFNRKPKQLAIVNTWYELAKKNRNILSKLQQNIKKIFPANPTKRKNTELQNAVRFFSPIDGGLDFLDSLLKADFLLYTFSTETNIRDFKEFRELLQTASDDAQINAAYQKAKIINNGLDVSYKITQTPLERANNSIKLSFAQSILLKLQLQIATHEITDKPKDTKYKAPSYATTPEDTTEQTLSYFKIEPNIIQ